MIILYFYVLELILTKNKILLTDYDIQQQTSQEWSKLKKRVPCQLFNSVKEVWPLSKDYDLIIIDAPARTSQGTLETARNADLIIQPTGASRADLVPAVKEFNALKASGISKNKTIIYHKQTSHRSRSQSQSQSNARMIKSFGL